MRKPAELNQRAEIIENAIVDYEYQTSRKQKRDPLFHRNSESRAHFRIQLYKIEDLSSLSRRNGD